MTMPARMFVWYELMTPDLAGAEAFYRRVIGWGSRAAGVAGKDYSLFTTGDAPVAGMMPLTAEVRAAGVPPHWMGYVGVDDVDAMTAQFQAAGGRVHHGPEDIPEVGRFSVVADPQGAVLGLFSTTMPAPAGGDCSQPGFAAWRELYANDGKAALDFYGRMFGWVAGEAHDMGPMGVYQLYGTSERKEDMLGGMMSRPPQVPAPAWLYYFSTDSIDGAVSRIGQGGGQVVNGPMEVPGGAWIIQAFDPQGAMFALVGPR